VALTNYQKDKLFFYYDQNWTCSGCGQCCKVWDVPITNDEKESIENLKIPGYNFEDKQYFIQNRKNKNLFYIKKIDDKCIFQGDDELCIIHKLYGEPAKPLACRMFPMNISLWNDGSSSVSFRHQCLAVSEHKGKGITKQLNVVKRLIAEVSPKAKKNSVVYSKKLKASISSLKVIAEAYKKIIFSEFSLLKTNVYYAACLLNFHKDLRNKNDILSPVEFEEAALTYLKENFEILEATVDNADHLDKSNIMAFSYLLTGYIRVDEEMRLKGFFKGRITRALSILRFILNKGTMKDFGDFYPDTSGINILEVMGEINFSKECEEVIKRYMAVQLDALHFCGKQGIDLTFEEGLSHLLLAYPIAYALAAFKCASEGRKNVDESDITYSIRVLDHAFYHSPFFKIKHVKKLTAKLTSEKLFPQLLALL
jgi:lysine-N-methylase